MGAQCSMQTELKNSLTYWWEDIKGTDDLRARCRLENNIKMLQVVVVVVAGM